MVSSSQFSPASLRKSFSVKEPAAGGVNCRSFEGAVIDCLSVRGGGDTEILLALGRNVLDPSNTGGYSVLVNAVVLFVETVGTMLLLQRRETERSSKRGGVKFKTWSEIYIFKSVKSL